MLIAKQPSNCHNRDYPKERMIAYRFGKAKGESVKPSAAHPTSGTGDAHDMLDGAGDPQRKEQQIGSHNNQSVADGSSILAN